MNNMFMNMIMNTLRNNANRNPILANVLRMMENGDSKGIEELARNLCRERNINPDEAIKQLKSQMKKP